MNYLALYLSEVLPPNIPNYASFSRSEGPGEQAETKQAKFQVSPSTSLGHGHERTWQRADALTVMAGDWTYLLTTLDATSVYVVAEMTLQPAC